MRLLQPILILAALHIQPALSLSTPETLRVAVYNIRELSTEMLRNVDEAGCGRDTQTLAAAEVVKRVRPHVLLLLEIDHDYTGAEPDLEGNARRFGDHYLGVGEEPIEYPHVYSGPCNTGIPSGVDLDKDGVVATKSDAPGRVFGNDCYGYGNYPGQYSMALLSQVPLDEENIRTFQQFRWKDLPNNNQPTSWYSADAVEAMRLSSKSHWDIPIVVGDRTIHLLACHPTPQGFDGPEDRNGARNFDELALWAQYLDGSTALVDDEGQAGGLTQDRSFIVIGDLNASPIDGSQFGGKLAISQLLEHPRIQDTTPQFTSKGALWGRAPGAPNFPERHTFGSKSSTTQIDYILPSQDLNVVECGVYWPDPAEDFEGALLAEYGSDHRLLWMDIQIAD